MRAVYPLAALLLLAGCAFTPYQAKTERNDGGYVEHKLAEGRYAVRFVGTADDDFERVQALAIRRAAEIARDNGYAYFAVTANRSRVKQRTEERPTLTRANPSGDAILRNYSLEAMQQNPILPSDRADSQLRMERTTVALTVPEAWIEIVCLKSPNPEPGTWNRILNVDAVLAATPRV